VIQVLAVAVAYLLGSINFGVLVCRARGVDIYSVGSGNPGTSNVMRALGKKLAALVLLGDGAKGAAAAAIGLALVDPGFPYVALLAAVVGHALPIWHHFRGGKSVATAIGGLVFVAPVAGLALAAVWIVVLGLSKMASLASLAAMVISVPFLALAGRRGIDLLLAGAIALFVIVRHGGNIKRLLSASERKVS